MLKVDVPHPSVVFSKEVLGEVIGKVFSSFLLVQAKLVLFDESAHQAETQVKILGALQAHVASEDAVGGRAGGLDWGGRLRVAHFDEGHSDGNFLLAVEENISSFGLRGGNHDGADALAFGEYWYIRGGSGSDVGRWRIVA